MKQIHVDEKCSGCGLCTVNSTYLEENEDGNAFPVAGKYIKEEDLAELNKVICDCPEGALSIIETSTTTKGGIEGVNEILEGLNKMLTAFQVKIPEASQFTMKAARYSPSIPISNKQNKFDYSSERSAKSAARDEISRLCYSDDAIRIALKKVFVEYKVNVLKPYYSLDDDTINVYMEYNKQIAKYLADVQAEIESIVGEGKIPSDWKEFKVYPDKKGYGVKTLEHFEDESRSLGIINAFRNYDKDFTYQGLDRYMIDIDIDDMEICTGAGVFGNLKYKTMYCFTGFYNAARECMEDLEYVIDEEWSDRICEFVCATVEDTLSDYERKVKEVLENKIQSLKKCL